MMKKQVKNPEETRGSDLLETQLNNSLNADEAVISNEVVCANSNISCPKFPVTIEPLVCMIFLAYSLSEPVITNLILIRSCETHFHYNKSVCSQLGTKNENKSDIEALIQPYATVILTGMNFLVICLPAIMSFFLAPWSDYNGRKLLFIAPAIGYFLKCVVLIVFLYVPNLDSSFALVAAIPAALSGGFVNFISAVFSYMGDITTQENRSFRIAVVESSIYFGNIIGFSCTSYIFKASGNSGYLVIFGLCAAISLVAAITTYFFVPESIQSVESRKKLSDLFQFKLLKEMIVVCFKKRDEGKRLTLFLVIISLTITISAMDGESNIMFLYTRLHFGWNIQEFSLWSTTNLITAFLGILIGITVLLKWLKISDTVLLIISYGTKAISCFCLAFIPSNAPFLMYYLGLISLFSPLCGAAGRAVLSKIVPKEDIGKVFGLTVSSESLFPLMVAPLYTLLYNSTINVLPSAFSLLSGSIFLLSTIFCIVVHFIQKHSGVQQCSRLENEGET